MSTTWVATARLAGSRRTLVSLPHNYPFADAFAPDYIPNVNVPLSDFFGSSQYSFTPILAPYAASCFIHPGSCRTGDPGPLDPDNDVIDSD